MDLWMSAELFVPSLQAIGLMALCTLAYGYIQHSIHHGVARRWLVGLLLGSGAVISMMHPFVTVDGYQVDARSLFLAIAAAFGGFVPMMIAAVMATLARLAIGGAGVFLGLGTIVITCLLAGVWAYCTQGQNRRSLTSWLVLGVFLSAPMVVIMWMMPVHLPQVMLARVATDLVGTLIFGKMFETELRRGRRERQLNLAASTDPLTGLPNRRALMQFVGGLSEAARRDMSLLIVDVDHFKKINDTYGHQAGDEVLQGIGHELAAQIRQGDFAARFGGEEFIVLLHGDGRTTADRLRHSLSKLHVIDGRQIRVTVSVGGSTLAAGVRDYDSAYAKADAALYDAKRQGRDRAVFAA